MEEEIIRKSFCNYCKNKGNNCIKIQIEQNNLIKTYKCLNYIKADIMPLNKYENYSRI